MSDIYEFKKEHNITKKVALLGLRHSTATFLLSIGIPKKDVAKHLGHTPEVLDRIYTHSDEKENEKLRDEIKYLKLAYAIAEDAKLRAEKAESKK